MSRNGETAWVTNTDAHAIAKRLRRARTAVVVTHAKPDGDAAGSSLAMARSLIAAGVETQVWYVGPTPHWLSAVARETPRRVFAPGVPANPAEGSGDYGVPPPAPEMVAVVDTGSWTQLAELRGWLTPLRERVVLMDHHLHGDTDVSDQRLIVTHAASATEVVAPVCRELVGVARYAELPTDVAEPLYLGLATDTGWFKQSNVSSSALRLAADLLEAGVVHTRLYQLVEQRDRPSRLRLQGRALASLELYDDDRIAIMSLRREDYAATGADRNDSTGFVEGPMNIATVQVSAVLTEQEPGPDGRPVTKMSLRSKEGPGAVDVNEVCGRLGGGGHARASGAKVNMDLESAKAALLKSIRESTR